MQAARWSATAAPPALHRTAPSPGRGQTGWSTSAPSGAPSPKPLPSTHAATSSATPRPQATPNSTRRYGTPRQEEEEVTLLRIFGAVVVAALLIGGAGASTGLASASRNSTVTAVDLGVLGGTFSFASAVSPTGQVVGESTTASGQTHPFTWTQAGGLVDR